MAELRLKRIERLLQEEIGSMISGREIKDPRIDSLVRITGAEVSRDLGHCKVFVSYYGDLEKTRQMVEVLNHSAGFIQRVLGRRIRLRTTPHLVFIHDESLERGFRITQKLKEL